MRIISYNVNGIRAAIKKGFIDWLSSNPADIICLQETKATEADVDTKLFEKAGYTSYWFSAQKKGYSGVAVLTKIKPDAVKKGTGHAMSDNEGRVIELQFGEIKMINAYFPSGTSGDERQNYKYQWLDEIADYLKKLKKKNPKLILCGDYNIAHQEIDIHDPKGNKNSSGFLPEEREWFTQFLDSGWIDSFRVFHPEPHRYSWWSQRFPSVRLNNKGWRIDYINATEALKGNLLNAEIYPDIKHSDHCPVYLEIKI
ncbi:MAG TPA: exodeoxyribonuclease III [Ferruginibacter sp.]|nr:exodeoxyribonuclease III [Bacteroidota bacterium]MBS1926836.1 exodeoxyribonuclease III [Bacteroidota bacterium]MCC6693507.1 exodeoxyribonuclease III [Chitinophagaceae bacterium]HMT95167.1 exodeoxyribonuclease III [Ferruginibacter sp.]HMU23552.1 exodeoxyribonuclease III [Ferruginibacter sp.]